MSVLLDLLFLASGFYLLATGADRLVGGGAAIARRLGISPLMVGLTVVAWGTSMPEVVVSAIAAIEGKPAIALGNVLGSNVANIGLVLGCSGLVLPTVLAGRVAWRELAWLIGSLLALWYACHDRLVTRIEGLALLTGFLVYTFVLVRGFRSGHAPAAVEEAPASRHPLRDVLVGAIAIAIGAELVVRGASGLALRAGMSQTQVGLTVIAIGTSLPELAAGLGSALKGEAEIGLGNVIGSNLFNTLAVLGIAALLRPFGGDEPVVMQEMTVALGRDFPVNMAFSFALVLIALVLRGRHDRAKALLLAASYFTYIVLLFPTGAAT